MTLHYPQSFINELVRQSEAIIASTRELISSEVNATPQTPTKGE
jgi:hypothetical protein